MGFLITFWKPIAAIVGVIILLATLGVAKHHYDEGKRAEGRAETQAKWDDEKVRAEKAVADQETKYKAERDAREKAEKERDDALRKRTEMAQNEARSLPAAVAAIRVPARAASVLNRAIDAGNTAKTAGPAAKPAEAAPAVAEGADSTVGLLTQWGVTCIAAYDEARGMVTGWQEWYASLQKAQGAP